MGAICVAGENGLGLGFAIRAYIQGSQEAAAFQWFCVHVFLSLHQRSCIPLYKLDINVLISQSSLTKAVIIMHSKHAGKVMAHHLPTCQQMGAACCCIFCCCHNQTLVVCVSYTPFWLGFSSHHLFLAWSHTPNHLVKEQTSTDQFAPQEHFEASSLVSQHWSRSICYRRKLIQHK